MFHDPGEVAGVWHPFRMLMSFDDYRGCRSRWSLNPRLISGIASRCCNGTTNALQETKICSPNLSEMLFIWLLNIRRLPLSDLHEQTES